jgi:DNA-binding NarL/FixJ family response regulator
MKTLRAHGVKPTAGRAGRHSYGSELSPRELEVVRLLLAGRTVREIAEDLFLSPKTVDRHVDSARRKLRAPSRIALAAAALEMGIVSSGDKA